MENLIKKIGIFGMHLCACSCMHAMTYDECRFLKAVYSRNTAAKNIAEAGHIDVNFTDSKGVPIIIYTAYAGDISAVDAMFRSGSLLISKQSLNGMTALHAAAFRRNLKMVKRLVEHGADVNILNNQAEPPLYFADADTSGETSKYLIEHGADESKKKGDIKRFGKYPVHAAVFFNYVITLHRMLEDGADPNIKMKFTVKRLKNEFAMRMMSRGITNREVIKMMINELEWEEDNLTALQYAATNNKPACACLLLEHGAKIDYEAFFRARHTGSLGVTEIMLRYTPKLADFPLFCAIEFGDAATVLRVLQDGADPNAACIFDKRKETPLSLAADRNKPGAVALLLEYGADPLAEDSEIESPLIIAAGCGNIASLRILLRAAVKNPINPDFMNSLFTYALRGPYYEAVAALYEFYPAADFNCEVFPFMISAAAYSISRLAITASMEEIDEPLFFSYAECLNFFLSNGADINAMLISGLSINNPVAKRF